MSIKDVFELMDAVDSPGANGAVVCEVFARHSWDGIELHDRGRETVRARQADLL
jgi:hypothetical protein